MAVNPAFRVKQFTLQLNYCTLHYLQFKGVYSTAKLRLIESRLLKCSQAPLVNESAFPFVTKTQLSLDLQPILDFSFKHF